MLMAHVLQYLFIYLLVFNWYFFLKDTLKWLNIADKICLHFLPKFFGVFLSTPLAPSFIYLFISIFWRKKFLKQY